MLKKYLNAEILDADKIAKELTTSKTEYLTEIINLLGKQILDENNNLNRQALANIIYNNIEAKESLDTITFKHVCAKIFEEIETLKKANICEYILIDAPLLLEANLNEICNYIIAVISDRKIKIDRICKRDNISEEVAQKRLQIQKENDFYAMYADFIIENNGNEENIEMQIKEICQKL